MLVYKWLLLCICIGQFSVAQQKGHSVIFDDTEVEKQIISEDHLDKYKSDDDFNYEESIAEENFLDKAYRWFQNLLKQFWEAIFGVGSASGFLYFVFRVLPYIILGVLVFLLIRFFLKVNSNNLISKAKEQGSISFSEEEQIIKNEDIPALIKEAINQNNYRLAIRYYYLLSLKLMAESEVISWQPQKTNDDYINEIKKDHLKTDFKNITRIYDYVWYGEFNVDANRFETLRLPFENLNKTFTTR
ncbi:uncharacterized protein DUF4129 [Winogradskyella epiphytica]|uniref:Uncharacterized protein DUF4129 n=1 Tax=Winogradskyella epiphytica TaxID=262005 RepID=A0A2V4XG50_9FLAO|nr:DUF4129 domain-containing protein [Winogradskyella epiphytica]PYE82035.1 uncharacterized protein DUF4129 [Winogradskyella epiphytica]GGW60930.1 hypothetical protein GCM10008085_10590 [Winogradskyella epiphytica]